MQGNMMPSIDELLSAASRVSSPELVAESEVQVGGVDPLGLRQINFDLMDKILPGLNNVAERLRPFVLMTWAWRRVRVIIERDKLGGATDEAMRDFVDRIEAIYAWSQFLLDPNAGIPGGQALAELIHGEADAYRFGGKDWEKRRDLRRSSTGLISPLNYGPGLRSMGWLIPAGPPGVFQPNPKLEQMLDSFELGFGSELAHPAFNSLGAVDVKREDVRRWANLWGLTDLTEAERLAGFERLAGPDADRNRRDGLTMLEAAIRKSGGDDESDVRTLREMMSEPPGDWLDIVDLEPKADAWRRLQLRQLFRLTLEAMFYWILRELADGPLSSGQLAERFIKNTTLPEKGLADSWLAEAKAGNPVQLLNDLNNSLSAHDWPSVPSRIAAGLHFCLTAGSLEQWDKSEAFDRLPLSRALSEAEKWRTLPTEYFVVKLVEVWVIAQHAYWCVGRGLADARGRGKTLLRLRIVMDDGGWTLTPGTRVGGIPVPTPDRLQTAVTLLRECGRI